MSSMTLDLLSKHTLDNVGIVVCDDNDYTEWVQQICTIRQTCQQRLGQYAVVNAF